MPPYHIVVARRDNSNSNTAMTPMTIGLLVALIVLFAAIALLIGTLLVLRQMRRTKEQADRDTLPMYSEKDHSIRVSQISVNASHHEKRPLMGENSSAAGEGVPEIRITFPEEVDEAGKRTSGKVVVVRVGEHSVGLEPVSEQLPPYERNTRDRFESLDLDRMGGLKEKEIR